MHSYDYTNQSDITCPYCGWKDKDSWEHNMSDDDEEKIECGRCGKEFTAVASVVRTYSSYQD